MNQILLIDDEEVDLMTFKRAHETLNIAGEVSIAHNGEEALMMMESFGLQPELIFLDINMPRMNGIEFIQILKSYEAYREIPIVILTTSNHQSDKEVMHRHGIYGYFVKPYAFKDYLYMLDIVLKYWSLSKRAYS